MQEIGLRLKRYGPFSTIAVVGLLVSTRVPALRIVVIAQIASTKPTENTAQPERTWGRTILRRPWRGRFVKFSDILFAPKPVQKPCPALWIGGESGPAMRRAARIGDGWYPIGANPQHRLDTMARYRAAVERLRKLAADVGRDPASVALAFRVHRHGASAPAKADNGERFL